MADPLPLSTVVSCPHPPKETEALLRSFAHQLDLSVRRAGEGDWMMVAGDWLSTDPNFLRWSLRATLKGTDLHLDASAPAFPWARRRTNFIVGFRLNQFATMLGRKLAGLKDGMPTVVAKLEFPPHERIPFTAGEGPVAQCRLFVGTVLSMVAAAALIAIVVVAADYFVIDRVVDDLDRRVAVLERLKAPVVPPRHDLEELGRWGRLAAAIHLSIPVLFFLAMVHTLSHAANDIWRRCSRMPIGAALFTGGLSIMAWWPLLPMPLGLVAGLLVPFVAHVGTTLVWGIRPDFLAKPEVAPTPWKGPKHLVPQIVAVLALIGLGAIFFPEIKTGHAMTDQIALFRDRHLYTNPAGKAFAGSYYRYTLYAAEAVKKSFEGRTFPDDPARKPYDKQAPLALLLLPEKEAGLAKKWLKDFGFTIEQGGIELAKDRAHDLYVTDGSQADALAAAGVGDRIFVIPKVSVRKDWEDAVVDASRRGYKAAWLFELVTNGWASIYYVGAFACILLVMTPVVALAGWIFLRFPAATGNRAIAAALVLLFIAFAALWFPGSKERSALAEFRATNADDAAALAKGLASPYPSVRHEAAFRYSRTAKRFDPAPLIEALNDGDFRVRLWAAAALGKTRNPAARFPLIEALDDPELFVRYRAAEGLGALEANKGASGAGQTVEALLRMIRTRGWYEANYAYSALREIDSQKW